MAPVEQRNIQPGFCRALCNPVLLPERLYMAVISYLSVPGYHWYRMVPGESCDDPIRRIRVELTRELY